jgi:predicted  nucleic acid-binding Zn-ribbon protein
MSVENEQSLDELAGDIQRMKDEIRTLRSQHVDLANRITVAENGLRVAVERFDARVAKVKR